MAEPTIKQSFHPEPENYPDQNPQPQTTTQFSPTSPPFSYASATRKEPSELTEGENRKSASLSPPSSPSREERSRGQGQNGGKGTYGKAKGAVKGAAGGGEYSPGNSYLKSEEIITSLPGIPVTKIRTPYVPAHKCADTHDVLRARRDSGYGELLSSDEKSKGTKERKEEKLCNAGTARANCAPSTESPEGTTDPEWVAKHAHQSVLQQHCAFFDRDNDGIVWPIDTYIGFHRLGFNIPLSLFAMFIIHVNFSYPTVNGLLPDPFFRIFLTKIHKTKHGSDTGSYDTEGRFIPQKFEDFFAKYSSVERKGEDEQGHVKYGLTLGDVLNGAQGQRVICDPIGWSAEVLEWLATYILLWPEDRIMRKEDIRKVYDGSIFYEIAERRENQSPQKQRARKSGIMEIMSQKIPRSVNELGDQVKGAGGEVQKLLDEQVNNHQGSFVWNMIRNAGAMIGNITFGTGKREQNFGDYSVKVRGNA